MCETRRRVVQSTFDNTVTLPLRVDDSVRSDNTVQNVRDSAVDYPSSETSNSLAEFYNNFDMRDELLFSPPSNENVTLKVHRGQVFEEMLLYFSSVSLPCGPIFIEMLLPNGNKEAAYDGGGVLRDALSEFWETFYEKCTEGNDNKISIIREDFNALKWEATAKVLLTGWQQVKYFPIKLAPVFIDYCVFGMFFSNLKDNFLKYLCHSSYNMQLIITSVIINCTNSMG